MLGLQRAALCEADTLTELSESLSPKIELKGQMMLQELSSFVEPEGLRQSSARLRGA